MSVQSRAPKTILGANGVPRDACNAANLTCKWAFLYNQLKAASRETCAKYNGMPLFILTLANGPPAFDLTSEFTPDQKQEQKTPAAVVPQASKPQKPTGTQTMFDPQTLNCNFRKDCK